MQCFCEFYYLFFLLLSMIEIKDRTARTVRRYKGEKFVECYVQHVKPPTRMINWVAISLKCISDICGTIKSQN